MLAMQPLVLRTLIHFSTTFLPSLGLLINGGDTIRKLMHGSRVLYISFTETPFLPSRCPLLELTLFSRTRPAALQTTAAALSLASLSLSSSPPPPVVHKQTSTSFAAVSNAIPIPAPAGHTNPSGINTSRSVPLDDSAFPSPPPGAPPRNALNGVQVAPISSNGSGAKNGKKRGTTFTCESCSKVCRCHCCTWSCIEWVYLCIRSTVILPVSSNTVGNILLTGVRHPSSF
jgi:hypothetical protein